MHRRSFLELLTVSGVIALAEPQKLIAPTPSVIESRFLGFALSHPSDWTVLTLFDEYDEHLGEWGGMKTNSYKPLAILSRYREPTVVPNHEIQIYPLGFIRQQRGVVGSREAKDVFDFLCSQRNDIYALKSFVDCDCLPKSTHSASWRTHGVDGRQDFIGMFHIVHDSKNPFLIVRAWPRNDDESDTSDVLSSLKLD